MLDTIVGFILGLFGSLITLMIREYLGNRKDTKKLKRIKQFIIHDVDRLIGVLDQMKNELNKMKDTLESGKVLDTETEEMQDLHSEIYDSIPNPELYAVFETDMFKIVNFYKCIDYLKGHDCFAILRWYADNYPKLHNKHKGKFKGTPESDRELNVLIAEHTLKTITNHLVTISELNGDGRGLIGKYDPELIKKYQVHSRR